ncbi:hypothetical protein HK104_008137 [Borealophlyctis nickersoniae]|nr:hypothetical protein HK104_008137 [Borealophlyctis nickersoniae]
MNQLPHLAQFAQTFLKPGEEMEVHAHRSVAEVLFIQQGVGEVHVDGDVEFVGVGSAVAVRSGVGHRVKNTGQDYLWILYFGIEDVE